MWNLAIVRYMVLKKIAPKTRFRSYPDATDTKLIRVLLWDAGSKLPHPTLTTNSLSAGVFQWFFRNPFQNHIPATDTFPDFNQLKCDTPAVGWLRTRRSAIFRPLHFLPHRANLQRRQPVKQLTYAGAASWMGHRR